MAAHVAQYKKDNVKNVLALAKEYPIIGVVNMEGLPAQQLQAMRSELRDQIALFMTKKTLMRVALEEIKKEKPGIEKLESYMYGMPALLFTKDSPFKLSKTLQKKQTAAPARSGQTAPEDIVVPAGPTPFAPGPIISELSGIGLQVGVEGGKVAVKEDGVVAKAGEKITAEVAGLLTRLDIKPMKVGLDLVAAYEDGIVYEKSVMSINEEEFLGKLSGAASGAFNLAFDRVWVTKDNAELLIAKAFMDAKAIGLEQNIIDEGVIDDLLAKGERQMLGLKSTANIETVSKPKPEEKKEEPKAEEKKEEKPVESPKEEKKETPAQESKPEEKKEEVKEEKPVEQPKEEVKEAPKEEAKEEKQEAAPKEESKPEEKKEEVKEESKKEPKEASTEEKVEKMVEETKKQEEPQPSAQDIVEEVKQESKSEEKPAEEKKEEKVEEKQKEPVKEEPSEAPKAAESQSSNPKTDDNMQEVEDLTKELIKKGTLRK